MRLPHRTLPSSLLLYVLALLSACGGESKQQTTALTAAAMNAPVGAPISAPPSNTVSFPYPRKDYRIEATATGFQVRGRYSDGTDTPTQVSAESKLIFSDYTVTLSIAEQAKKISIAHLRALIELYVAFFNRIPEADGMVYWIQQVQAGMTLEQVANHFYTAAIQYADVTGYSGTMSNVDFVNIIYKNVLGRSGSNAPPTADVNYWAGELSSGKISKSGLVLAMLNSAHSFAGDATWGWVPQLLDNKVGAGSYFAIEEGLGYVNPNEAITKGVEIAARITTDGGMQIRNMLQIFDAGLDLLMPSPFSSGTGNSGACFNADLYKTGASTYTERTSISRYMNAVSTAAVVSTANGSVTFNGIAAQELVVDTTPINGVSFVQEVQHKSYVGFTNDAMLTYGGTQTIKYGADTNIDMSDITTPAERTPFSLSVNQTFNQDYVATRTQITTTISTNDKYTFITPHHITNSTTFLGTEPVVTPAGTFNACKFRHHISDRFTDLNNIHDEYTWIIEKGTWRGMLAKSTSPYELIEATKFGRQ